MAFVCAFCRHANPADAKFCNECGNTLRLRPCARCDAVNDVDTAQCHFCGTALSGDDAAKPKPSARERAPDRETAAGVQQGTGSAPSPRAQMAASAAPAMRAAPRANASPSRPSVREGRTAPAAQPPLASIDAAEADERIAETSSSIIRALELVSREPSRTTAPITVPAAALPPRPRRRLRNSVVATLAGIVAVVIASVAYLHATGASARIDIAGLRGAWSALVDRLTPDARTARGDDGAAQRVTAARPITTVGAAGAPPVEAAAGNTSAPAAQAVVSAGDAPAVAEPKVTPAPASAPPPSAQPAPASSPSTVEAEAAPTTQPAASDNAPSPRTVDAQPGSSATKAPRAVKTASPRRGSRTSSSQAAAANAVAPRISESPSIAPSAPAIAGPCTAGVAALGLCEERRNAR